MKPSLIAFICASALSCTAVFAQDCKTQVEVKFRGSFKSSESASNFAGERILVRAFSRIDDNFTFYLRHNFNRINTSSDLFAGTDWAYVNWQSNDSHWFVNAGKVVLDYGSIEYDAKPIDVYITSLYWDLCSPFRFGVVGGYHFNESNSLQFGLVNSPFSFELDPSLLAYSVAWYGQVGALKTIWSANLMEYAKGKYSEHLSLGNSLDLNPFTVIVDLTGRTSFASFEPFTDYTVATELSWKPSSRARAFAKATYDVNKGDKFMSNGFERTWLPDNTEYWRVGCGAEYYPVDQVRLHAYYMRSNGHISGVAAQDYLLSVGVSLLLCFKK